VQKTARHVAMAMVVFCCLATETTKTQLNACFQVKKLINLAMVLVSFLLESVVNIPRNYGEKDRHVSCQKDRLFQGGQSVMLKK